MERVMLITGTEIIKHPSEKEPMISFRFMFDSEADSKDCLSFDLWGWARLEPKSDDYFDPWNWAKGEPCVGDFDGIPRWSINVYKSGEGIFFGSGFDYDQDILKKTVREMPNCVLLIHRAQFDDFKAACEAEGVEVLEHHFDGPLKTS